MSKTQKIVEVREGQTVLHLDGGTLPEGTEIPSWCEVFG